MVRVITALSGLVLVVLALRLAMAPLFPLDKFVAPAVSAFEAETGTAVKIGRADLELLPTPRVVASDVGIELPDGLGDVRVDRLVLALGPLPFLSGSTDLESVTVERPVLRLSLRSGDLDPARIVGALANITDRAALRRFQATDGRLTLSSGSAEASFEGLTVSGTGDGKNDKLVAKATLRDTPVTLTMETGSGGAARVQISASPLSLGIDGGLAGGAFAGTLDLSIPEIAAFGGPFSSTAGAMKLKGAITLSSGLAEMVDASVSLFGGDGRLSAALDLARPRGSVDLHADFSRLPADTIATLATLAAHLGFDPIGGAAPFDAGVDLKVAELSLPGGGLRKFRVTVVDRDGRFGARVDGLAGDGVLSGRFDLLPEGNGRRLAASFTAKDFKVVDLAGLAGITPPLTGRLAADLRLSGHGRSVEELAASLALDGAGQLRDGRLAALPVAGDIALPELGDLSADLSVTGLDKPARLTGEAKAASGRILFEVAAPPRRLIEGGAAPVVARFEGGSFSATFDGGVDPVAANASGDVALTSRRLRTLLGIASLPQDASLAGHLEAGGGRLTLAEAQFLLGNSALGGVLDLALSDDRARLTGRLSGDRVDVAAMAGGLADALSGTGRSRVPAIDADLRIEAGGIVAGPLAAAGGPVDLRLSGDGAEIGLPRLALGGGSGSATLMLRPGERRPLAIKGRLDGARLASLTPLIGEAVDGELDLSADLGAEGGTWSDLAKSAAGTVDFSVSHGVLDDLDPMALLGRLARSVQTGFGRDAGRVGFDGLSGHLNVRSGSAVSDDLTFSSGDLKLSGTGSLGLERGILDLRFKPEVAGLGGFEVPVAVVGPLLRPRLYPDLPGLSADPAWGYARLATMGGGFARLVSGGEAAPKLEAVKPDAMTSMIDRLDAAPKRGEEASPPMAVPASVAPLPLERPVGDDLSPRREKAVSPRPVVAGGPLDLGALGRASAGAAANGVSSPSCRPGRDGRCIP